MCVFVCVCEFNDSNNDNDDRSQILKNENSIKMRQ